MVLLLDPVITDLRASRAELDFEWCVDLLGFQLLYPIAESLSCVVMSETKRVKK